jgi:hypothetical protein
LRQVTTQHEADVLVAPTLARTSNELVLTLLRFDARTGKTQRVLRRQTGQSLDSATLDSVPGLLRELFEVPEPKPAPVASVTPPASTLQPSSAAASGDATSSDTLREAERLPEPPMEAPGPGRSLPIGPLLLGGGGVVLLGAGLVMGLTVLSANSDYDTKTEDLSSLDHASAMRNVDEAVKLRDTGGTNAVVANVFYGLGSAVLIASGIWLAVELSERSSRYDDSVRLSPLVGHHELGLVLTHRGAGL